MTIIKNFCVALRFSNSFCTDLGLIVLGCSLSVMEISVFVCLPMSLWAGNLKVSETGVLR